MSPYVIGANYCKQLEKTLFQLPVTPFVNVCRRTRFVQIGHIFGTHFHVPITPIVNVCRRVRMVPIGNLFGTHL